MSRPDPLVFINYRDRDQPWVARMLDQELARRLGPDAVFLDNRSVPPGTSYDTSLLAAVRGSAVLLVVIGERWFATGEDGTRLIDRRQDWVRREIATAFGTGTRVVPVLVGDVPRLSPDRLPQRIRRLARCQAVELRSGHYQRDLAHIVEVVLGLVGGLVRGGPVPGPG